jgi:pimeloyl-ACP methyl ester carboxylesterase
MPERWIVFGGWAVAPDILRPVFGDESVYVDVNGLMPFIVQGGSLLETWPDIIRDNTAEHFTGKPARIAGWSTGAILACGLAKLVLPEKLVLLSATPSFCRREGFKYGQRPSVLTSMRKALLEADNTVLPDFFKQSAIKVNELPMTSYDAAVLAKGLVFLEKVNLLGSIKRPFHGTIILHGSEDKVVPHKAGENLAEMLGAEFKLFEGGHAFFMDKSTELRRMI